MPSVILVILELYKNPEGGWLGDILEQGSPASSGQAPSSFRVFPARDVWVTAAWLPVWLCQKSSDTLPLFGPQFSHLQSGARRRALNSFGILGPSRNLMKSEDPLPRNSSPPVSLPGGHCIHTISSSAGSAQLTSQNALYNSRAYTHDPAGTPQVKNP